MTLKLKLTVDFAVVLMLTAILGVLGITNMVTVNEKSTEMAENWMPSIAFFRLANSQSMFVSRGASTARGAKHPKPADATRSATAARTTKAKPNAVREQQERLKGFALDPPPRGA